MNYREINRLAAVLCGLIAFAVIIMIGLTSFDFQFAESGVNINFN